MCILLKNLRNYESYMAVYQSLASLEYKMKTSFKHLCEEDKINMSIFKNDCTPIRNFKQLRYLMSTASPPSVPQFAIFTKDFFNLHELPSRLSAEGPGGTRFINFARYLRLAQRLDHLHIYQQDCYKFEIDEHVRSYLEQEFQYVHEKLSEDDLNKLAKNKEEEDKIHYHKLKSKTSFAKLFGSK